MIITNNLNLPTPLVSMASKECENCRACENCDKCSDCVNCEDCYRCRHCANLIGIREMKNVKGKHKRIYLR